MLQQSNQIQNDDDREREGWLLQVAEEALARKWHLASAARAEVKGSRALEAGVAWGMGPQGWADG